MAFLEILQLIGYSTAAALHAWIAASLVRRRRVLAPLERVLLVLATALGVWHASNLLVALHAMLGLSEGRWTVALRLADTLAVASVTLTYSLLLHVHLHLWADARRRALTWSERARVYLSYVPALFLFYAAPKGVDGKSQSFVFASEAKAILASGLVRAELDAEALNQRAPLTIRANALKTTCDALAAALAAEGARVEPTPYSPDGLTFTSRTNVFALAAFKQGLFEVQDEGSQLIAEACNARPGQIVVDACAGAGGKSLALAAAMQNKGRLVACDRDGRRLDEFRLRSRRAGVHNWEARTVPEGSAGERRIGDLRGMADVVLVDAPCSGLGSLRRNPDALARYSDLVRPGGLLVYATCSINRAENEDVGAAFLAAHPGFSPEPVSTLLGEARAKEIGAREHDLQLLPDRHGTDGFYLTGFRREGA